MSLINPAIGAALQAGATLVTGSQRLALRLTADYAEQMQAAGHSVFAAPTIEALGTWTLRQWQRWQSLHAGTDRPLPQLLSPTQSLALWESAIAVQESGRNARITPLARAAAEAWQRLHAYALPLDHPAWHDTEESAHFQRWARDYQASLHNERRIDRANLSDRLATFFTTGELDPPATLLLAGFDEQTPQQQALFDAMRQRGTQIETVPPIEIGNAHATRTTKRNAAEELAAAANWTRKLLLAGASGPIGIIVPDLAMRRDEVARAFEHALLPSQLRASTPGAGDAPSPINMSLGNPLAAHPVIHTALRLLGWCQEQLPLEQASALLRNRFWATPATEAEAVSLLDLELRESHPVALTIKGVLHTLRRAAGREAPPPWHCPILLEQLQRADALHDTRRGRTQSAAQWAEHASKLLRELGWPTDAERGGQALGSGQYQAVERFKQLLRELRGLDQTCGELSFGNWLGWLRRSAGETLFQPESPSEAPVQILGLLEASGLTFTHLWVCGMTDEAWPAPGFPHPLLPKALQRERDMPHASVERELRVAKRTTQRLATAAHQIVFSYPTSEGDRRLRPSALIAAYPPLATDAESEHIDRAQMIHASATLESVDDAVGAALVTDGAVRGGQQILARQSLCPFSAYARFRLQASSPEGAAPGLDQRDRGNLVHYALEHLFQQITNSEQLRALSEDALRKVTAESVEQALGQLRRKREPILTPAFCELEATRLQGLLLQWLAAEKQRAPFSVEACEAAGEITLGGLTLRIKADRIDQCSERGRLVIDYKTSASKRTVKSTHGERPDEPQLPLYAITHAAPVDGIAFANVHTKHLSWSGETTAHVKDPLIAVGRTRPNPRGEDDPSWGEVIALWRQTLEGLARDFVAGHAAVDPKSANAACTWCDLTPVCRITEGYRSEEAEFDDID